MLRVHPTYGFFFLVRALRGPFQPDNGTAGACRSQRTSPFWAVQYGRDSTGAPPPTNLHMLKAKHLSSVAIRTPDIEGRVGNGERMLKCMSSDIAGLKENSQNPHQLLMSIGMGENQIKREIEAKMSGLEFGSNMEEGPLAPTPERTDGGPPLLRPSATDAGALHEGLVAPPTDVGALPHAGGADATAEGGLPPSGPSTTDASREGCVPSPVTVEALPSAGGGDATVEGPVKYTYQIAQTPHPTSHWEHLPRFGTNRCASEPEPPSSSPFFISWVDTHRARVRSFWAQWDKEAEIRKGLLTSRNTSLG